MVMRMDPKFFGPDKVPLTGSPIAPRPCSSRNLYFACVCSYMGALSFGYMIGYSSPTLPQMKEPGQPLQDEGSASWFGSLVSIGGMVGCFIAGWLVEKAGRKGTLLCTLLPYLVGWGLIFMSSDVSLLCLGRLLTGIGSGMVTVTSPMYVAEISIKDLRGMLGSGVQLSITLGILLVYCLGMVLGWRSLALIGMFISIVGAVMSLKIPDSPRFLLARGRKVEAERALSWLRGPLADVDEELRDMEESLDVDDEKLHFSDFCKPALYQPLRAAVGLMIFQQLSGINVVMFYTVSIFQSAGFQQSQLATVVIGVVQVLGTLLACFVMDKAGRRVLLLIAGLGMAVTCGTMGLYYYLTTGTYESVVASWSWLALTSLVIYTIAFSLGWGPIPMLVMSEIFPVKARGTASAIASVVNWTFAFIVTKEFSALQSLLGLDGAFCFFGGCCLIGMLFVVKFVPETKGKSLEDIELYFLGRSIREI